MLNVSPRFFLQPAVARIQAVPLPCALQLPGGRRIGAEHPRLALIARDLRALMHLAQGAIGRLAEDYVEGRLEIEGRLRDLMLVAPALLARDPTEKSGGVLARTARAVWEHTRHTRRLDAEQIRHHYDVSDDFYALWLDPRRVYSCAYFASPSMSLAQAQEAKLDLICRKLRLAPGERFLDIGAGWGALLLWAAQHYGVHATGITLSENQHRHVSALIASKGLQDRVRIVLQDYRDVDATEPYDKIASVGMCEHVGRANMTAYFLKIRSLLRPGGLLLNHAITAGGTDNTQLDGGMGDFIERYIFPGGQLIHVGQMVDKLARGGLEPLDVESWRPHYARTLWHWVDALESNLDRAREVLGARAEKILRAYRLYLAGSAMGFERGWISIFQVLATNPGGSSNYPYNRAYMYAPVGAGQQVGVASPD